MKWFFSLLKDTGIQIKEELISAPIMLLVIGGTILMGSGLVLVLGVIPWLIPILIILFGLVVVILMLLFLAAIIFSLKKNDKEE